MRPLLLVFSFLLISLQVEVQAQTPYTPEIAPASDEAERAIKNFRVTSGFDVELFAAEPHLANPVCFFIDNQGRFYVGETFRHHAGVTDMRGHTSWLEDDLACRTIEDRLESMRKNLGDDFPKYSTEHDRVRLVEDTDGDGKADKATVFADGFSDTLDGIGAGLLADQGDVYFTCIPDLYKLRDIDGDGKADTKTSLSRGYGVHINYLGHDLHGLRKGPDGKIYFSIGDRGFHVKTQEGSVLNYPDTGAVLRCNPDGSQLEVVHTGLRNPQELAFDDYGNLFTGDNNSDAGDKARWVYIVEGGETGWHIGWQWISSPNARGPWNSERMWDAESKSLPAYIVPPLANIGAGPSGLAYYPGTGLTEKYKGYFFMCDFRGDASTSRIHAFKVKPKGASFEVEDVHDFITGVLATDADFAPGGGLYLTDWVQGWDKPKKGRIYRITNAAIKKDRTVQQTKKLLGEGMVNRTEMALGELLLHPDQRVRLEAQWELARRGDEKSQEILILIAATGERELSELLGKGVPGPKELRKSERALLNLVTNTSKNRIARLHAIWGLGQIRASAKPRTTESPGLLSSLLGGKRSPGGIFSSSPRDPYHFVGSLLTGLLEDSDEEVRAQAAKVLGDTHVDEAVDDLIRLLDDPSVRVRFFAAIALGKIGPPEARHATKPLLEMLRENNDADAYLRHAGVMGLAGVGDLEELLAAAQDESAAVRMGVLLALRRMGREEISRFLRDPDPRLVVEAARAINDLPIAGALPELAAMLDNPEIMVAMSQLGISDQPLAMRAVNANFRLGRAENAKAVAQFAIDEGGLELARAEALSSLGLWAKPPARDRVTGLYNPLPERAATAAAVIEAIRPIIPQLVLRGPEKIQIAAAKLAADYKIEAAGPELFRLIESKQGPAEARVEALRALAAIGHRQLGAAVAIARADSNPRLRREANAQLAKLNPAEAVGVLGRTIEAGEVDEKQGAIVSLASMEHPEAERILANWMDRLIAGSVPGEIQFELIEAAENGKHASLRAKLTDYRNSISAADPLGGYRDLLAGGLASEGEKVFFESQAASCQRCHVLGGRGGGEAGPDLTGVGTRATREHLLESIVYPNRAIAKGFENVTLVLSDGKEIAGRVSSEDDAQVVLEVPVEAEAEEFIEDGGEGVPAAPPKIANPAPTASQFETVVIQKLEIRSRVRNLSSMPEGIANEISRKDIRNLVEFLATRK